MVGEKVIMIRNDGWGKPGWIGVIADESRDGNNVRVKWANGKKFNHSRRDMATANSLDDPNIVFLLQKSKKKGVKV